MMIDFEQLQDQVFVRIDRYERRKQQFYILSWTTYFLLLVFALIGTHLALQTHVPQTPAISIDVLTDQLDPFMDVEEMIQEGYISSETLIPPDSVYFQQMLVSANDFDFDEDF